MSLTAVGDTKLIPEIQTILCFLALGLTSRYHDKKRSLSIGVIKWITCAKGVQRCLSTTNINQHQPTSPKIRYGRIRTNMGTTTRPCRVETWLHRLHALVIWSHQIWSRLYAETDRFFCHAGPREPSTRAMGCPGHPRSPKRK